MPTIIRWGIIGCGDVVKRKSGPAFALAPRSELVALYSRNSHVALEYAQFFKKEISSTSNIRCFDNAEELIAWDGVDAVYVATPPSSHLHYVMLCAKHNKHCLVEKPMGLNSNECTRMVEAYESMDAPRSLFVAFYRRAFRKFREIKEILMGTSKSVNNLGTLTSVQVIQHHKLPSSVALAGWRFKPETSGGGLTMDLGSHILDLLVYLLGPVSLHGSATVHTSGSSHSVEDCVVAALQFSNSVLASLLFNWNSCRREDLLIFTFTCGELRTSVFGTDGYTISRPRSDSPSGSIETAYPFDYPKWVHLPLVEEIVNQLLDEPTKCEIDDAIRQSPPTGQTVLATAWVLDRLLDKRGV